MHFEKVSREEFFKSLQFIHTVDEKYKDNFYNNIKLPTRSTKGSIGYDFSTPFGFKIRKGENIVIPTGIRAVDMPENVGLFLMPRSGQGFKYRFSLANTIGVIDSDYMNADNEGHILIKLVYDGIAPTDSFTDIDYENDEMYVRLFGPYLFSNDRPASVNIEPGSKICQGVFIPCMFVDNEENIDKERTGGFGSTDEEK